MNLSTISTANLRAYYKHGRISESEFVAEIEQREDEQADIRENEREMFAEKSHPQNHVIDFNWYRSSEAYQ